MRVHEQTRNISFLFWFATFFWLLKNKYCCVSTCTLLLHDNRYVTQNHSPPLLFFARETTTTKKNTFLFRSPSFILAPLVILLVTFNRFCNSCARRAPGAKCTNHYSVGQNFFVPLFSIFFLFGNNNRSAVGGGWRRSSDGPRTTPPSTSSCDFRTKLLQRPKNKRS
jgi:hypothetical protein